MVLCVLIEGAFIALLLWRSRGLSQGVDSLSERLDAVIESAERLAECLSGTHRELLVANADIVRQVGIRNAEIAARFAGLSAQVSNVTADIIRDVNRIDDESKEATGKITDLSEGCAKIDADLSTFASDLEELGNLRRSDAKELGDRLTQLADEVEKARRRSARPATSGNSFDTTRAIAEKNARRNDPDHDRLVALAEG